MSGPLEELRAAVARVDRAYSVGAGSLAVIDAWDAVTQAARALLAASGTGERPADESWPERRARLRRWIDRLQAMTVEPQPGQMAPLGIDGPRIKLGELELLIHAVDRSNATPPDVGTGTPSDDGRWVDEVAELRASRAELDRVCAAHLHAGAALSRFGKAKEALVAAALVAAPTLTPAAPSGTTGATRGGPSHREPADGEEAVQALHAGVLERNMDGIPHGPGGWWPCKLTADAVRQGLGRFRIPIDWTPPTTGATTGDAS